MVAPTHPLIELRNLYRTFGNTRAVNNISFEVPSGTVFGYIGPNGAGKTTSMRILSTLELPSRGDAFVDGFSVLQDPDRVRTRLGFMPDYFYTYPNMNVWEYLDFFARSYGLVGRDRHRALQRVMSFTGLDKLAEKPISGLSKGMKQRLCLGRTIVHDPAVLILDEPAAGLDPRARIELREMIGQLAAEGKAILVSSHILTELGEMCDRVAIIELGTLVATGTVAEIQRKLQPHREVQIRVLGDVTAAMNWLSQRSDVSNMVVLDQTLRFSHEGEPATEAALLRDLVLADIQVVEFGTYVKSLEEVFLQVTRGAVQ
jgi:ABC-2 type transport system ATP-binding protein